MSDSRARMLANIRSGLANSRAMLAAEAEKAAHAPPPFVHPRQDDLAEQFAAELTRLAGHVHRCTSDGAALEAIGTILEQHNATQVIAWDRAAIGLPGLDDLLGEVGARVLDGQIADRGDERAAYLQALDPAPICISGADAAIAESGSLVLRSGPGRGRLASLLAPAHIAVLRRAQIVRGLGEALALMQQRHGQNAFVDSSNLTLITGPSRTGDIEQTLTLGVHGPREIHVVLIDDSAA